MRQRVQTVAALVMVALCLPAMARAFWPLDRNARAVTDSLSAQDWQERFDSWKQRPVGQSGEATDPMEEVRKAAQMGNLDPSLIARLAKQARDGTLPSQTAPAPSAPGAPAPSPASTDSTAVEGLTTQPGAGAPSKAGSSSATTTTAPVSGGRSTSATTGVSSLGASAQGDSLDSAGAFGAAPDSVDAFGNPVEVATDSVDAFGNPVAVPGGPAAGPIGGAAPGAASLMMMNRGFAPSLRAGLTSNNDNMRLDTSLSTSFADPSGVLLSANLSHNEELRLSQGSESDNNGLALAMTVPVSKAGMTFGISASGNRRSSLGARTVTAARTSDNSENRLARASANFKRAVKPGFDFTAYYARNFTLDQQTIAATSSASQGERSTQTTGNSFGVGADIQRLKWIKLRGNFGRSLDSRLFRSPSFITADNPSGETEQPSDGDTVSVRADMPIGGILPQLTAEFRVNRSDYSYTDVTRTSSGGQGSATEFAVETERRFSRSFRLQGSLEPFQFLSANFSYELGRDSISAVLRTSLFEDTKRRRWNIGSTLRSPWSTEIRFKFSGSNNDINKDEIRNPTNPQTREDRTRELSGEILQSFTKTLKVKLYANVSLTQGFYTHGFKETGLPLGDRDDSRAQLGFDLDGRISGKATARVQMYVRGFDQVFIDSLRSKDSRNETEYVVRQSFNYQVTPHVALRQFYGLSSKVVDELFDPNGDTLNRNHFLQTSMSYQMTSRLTMDARLDYRLQDNGFYIQTDPRSTARIFAATARTKTNEIGLGMRYALIGGNKLSFVSDQVATREYRTSFFSGRPTGTNVTNRGNLGLGLESKITLNDLSLDASVRRNQSFNVSLNRAVYYDVRSTLSYTF